MALSDKQKRFVAEYLIDLNGTQAAIRAGYSPNGADVQAIRLLANASIAEAVSKGTQRHLDKAELTAQMVLDEIRRLGFSDVRKLFDEQGNLKPLHLLTDDEAAAIASVEIVKKNLAAGDGHVDTVHKLKVWDKTKSLEMLAKHFGLLVDRLEHSGAIRIISEIPDETA